MNRETRTLVVVGVAVVVAALASFGVYRAVQRIPARPAEAPTMYTVVAAEPLSMGARLTRDNLKIVAWPANAPVEGSFSKRDQIIDRGLIADVVANEPITSSKLAPVGAGSGLPPAIPAGMRAISVKVNEVVGVAGFVTPGTRVDVLATVKQGSGREGMSRVVVSDVQVLTAGTRYDQDKARKEGKPIPSTVVTLMVTPSDAERIALASEEGKVMLALRNPLDVSPTETTGIRMTALMGTQPTEAKPPVARHWAAAPAPAAPAVVPVNRVYTVEAIRAAKRSEEVIH